MRADRLIAILLLLQTHGTLPARELAARLAVSKRTIYRDIEALSIAGIPVYARPGTDGGVSLDEAYRFSLNNFNRSELQALSIGTEGGALQDLGLERASEDLLLKLLATLPRMLRDEVRRTRQRIYIDPESWFDQQDPLPLLPILQQAVWQDRVVCMEYQHGDGTIVERVVEAYSLVAKANAWYFLGKAQGSEITELRTYHVARVVSAHLTEQHFERPASFDLAGYWQEHSRAFVHSIKGDRVPYEVVVRVREGALWMLIRDLSGRYTREAGVESSPGWLTLRITFPDRYPARMRVLSLADQVEVLQPDEFRSEIAQTLYKMGRLYKTDLAS